MKILEILGNVFVIISLIFLISSVVGLTLNRPVLFSYAISESMKPTIGVGDMFFINPFSKGDVGKIVVFRAEDIYVVHRVYAIENNAYITKGDSNIATDQLNGKNPPVSKESVIGEVVEFAGKPVLIPKAGSIVDAFHSNSIFLAAALITLGFLSLGREERRKDKKKLKISTGFFYGLVSSALIISLIGSTMLSWGEMSFSYASTLAGGQRDGWYLPGSEFEKNLNFENRAYYPMIFFFKEKGKNGELLSDKTAYLNPREKMKLEMRVSVPEETRIYSEGVMIYAFLPILPVFMTETLFKMSPLLPLVVHISLLFGILVAVYLISGFGEDYIILRKRRLKI